MNDSSPIQAARQDAAALTERLNAIPTADMPLEARATLQEVRAAAQVVRIGIEEVLLYLHEQQVREVQA